MPVGNGSPAVTAATPAVKETDCPYTGFDGVGASVALLSAVATTSPPATLPPLASKFPDESTKSAVTTWLPIASEEMVGLQTLPLARASGEPSGVPSILNCTVPVGVAVPCFAETVAWKRTESPSLAGLSLEETIVEVSVATTCVVCCGAEGAAWTFPTLSIASEQKP